MTWISLFFLILAAALQGSVQSWAEPTPWATLDEVAAQLPHTDVSGQVVDKSGRPLPEADVFVYYARGIGGLRDRLAGRTKTDGNGRFRLEKAIVWEPANEYIERGLTRYTAYYIIARHPTEGINFTPLREGEPADDVKVMLLGAYYAEPKVIDGEGKPVEGARVYISRGYRDHPGKAEATAEDILGFNLDIGLSSGVTGKDGKVRLLSLKNGSYSSVKEGLVRGRQFDRNTPAMMTPSAQVSGVVTDLEGKPVPGAAVMYTYQGPGADCTGVVSTDAQGRYCIKDAPCTGYHYSWVQVQGKPGEKGKLTLRADDLRYHSPLLSEPVTFTIDPGQKLEQNIRLARAAVVEGTILDINTGQPIAKMPFEPVVGDTPWTGRATDAQGSFWIKVPLGSEVSLSWQRSGRGNDIIFDNDWMDMGNWSAPIGVMHGDRTGLKLKIKRWQISPMAGRVIDGQGRGVGNVSIYLLPTVPPVLTASDGSFKLAAGPDDRDFELYAVSDDGAQACLTRLKAGTKDATLQLAPTRSYRGQVVNNLGEPGGSLQFEAHPIVNGSTFVLPAHNIQAGADGSFNTPPLCPQLPLECRWESGQKLNRDYSFGVQMVDLARLKPEAPIRLVAPRYLNALMGKVVDEKGNPIGGARFQVEPWNAISRDARAILSSSAKDGAFAIKHLAEGEATLIISAEGHKSRLMRVATESIDSSITLRPQTAPTTCKVTVVDALRHPLDGASVTLRLKLKKGDVATATSQTLATDSHGRCEFSWPALGARESGEGLVGVDLPGKAWTFAGVDPTRDEDLLLIARPVSEHPHGQIVDLAGKPVVNALLKLTRINGGDGPTETYNANAKAHVGEFLQLCIRTDHDGRYEWPGLGFMDHYEMAVSAPGMAERMVNDYSENVRESRFMLIPTGALRVRLGVRGGTPLQGGVVYLHSTLDRLNEPGKPYPLGSDGIFTAEGLLPSPYSIKYVISQGKHYVCSTPGSVQVESGETTNISLDLEESILFRGRLIDEKTGKAPMDRAWMTVKQAGGLQSIDGTYTDEAGRFQFRLPAGKFDFSYMVTGMQYPGEISSATNERGTAGQEQTFNVKIE